MNGREKEVQMGVVKESMNLSTNKPMSPILVCELSSLGGMICDRLYFLLIIPDTECFLLPICIYIFFLSFSFFKNWYWRINKRELSLSSLRFTEKFKRRYRDFPITPCPTHALTTHYQHLLQLSNLH